MRAVSRLMRARTLAGMEGDPRPSLYMISQPFPSPANLASARSYREYIRPLAESIGALIELEVSAVVGPEDRAIGSEGLSAD